MRNTWRIVAGNAGVSMGLGPPSYSAGGESSSQGRYGSVGRKQEKLRPPLNPCHSSMSDDTDATDANVSLCSTWASHTPAPGGTAAAPIPQRQSLQPRVRQRELLMSRQHPYPQAGEAKLHPAKHRVTVRQRQRHQRIPLVSAGLEMAQGQICIGSRGEADPQSQCCDPACWAVDVGVTAFASAPEAVSMSTPA